MNVTRKWRRFFAVGCTHAGHLDLKAWAEVMKFKERWKPDTTLHLGDFLDTSCWRAGARNSADDPDKSSSFADDYLHGIGHLKELRPDVVLLGNHEWRIFGLTRSSSAVVAYAAEEGVKAIEGAIKKLKAQMLPYDVEQGVYLLGNMACVHGYSCGEAALRDHTEQYGRPVLMAHTHRPEQVRGRTIGSPMGTCVGTLMRIQDAAYARHRRATLRWAHGCAFGEYCADAVQTWLATPVKGEWRFPV
ncbi:MAG: metallophosphoesterase [Verrucomicrobia bacterium]|nr:metallophosphoesterase [Verrucomicrobiota bacterium]